MKARIAELLVKLLTSAECWERVERLGKTTGVFGGQGSCSVSAAVTAPRPAAVARGGGQGWPGGGQPWPPAGHWQGRDGGVPGVGE